MSKLIKRIAPAATLHTHQRFAVLDTALLDRKAADSRANQRLREIHRFHVRDDAPLQRMLNAMQPGTYVRPHRHLHPPKAETFVILRGRAGLVFFEDNGSLAPNGLVVLDQGLGTLGVDIRPGVFHSVVILAPDTVLFEVKPGPYQAANDKDFPAWAPEPDTPEAAAYLHSLESKLQQST